MASPKQISVTILMENTARGRGILGEHGLSYYIQYAGRHILFDTGQTDALLHNARQLHIDLTRVDTIVLSHGHYDHVGGLPAVLQLAPNARLIFHPKATARKFSLGPDRQTRPASIPFLDTELANNPHPHTVTSDQPFEIFPGLWTTGEVPRTNDYEDTGGDFFLDADAARPDPIADDMSLFFHTDKGLVVLLGCAHAGLINTLTHITNFTGTTHLHAVIGGMHLLHAGPERLRRTFDALRPWNIQCLAPCHCTGTHAIAAFRQAFPDAISEAAASRSFSFKQP